MSPPYCLLSSVQHKSPLNELYEPVSVHGGISASFSLRFRREASLACSHTLLCGYARLEGSLVRSQVQSEDKLLVSGVLLASWFLQAMHVHGLKKKKKKIKKKSIKKFETYITCTRNPWIARAKYGSMVCTVQSMDCANPYFAPNIRIYTFGTA